MRHVKEQRTILENIWYSYEVTGMILLRDLHGIMRLHRRRDMSVHVSTYISYDFNALIPVLRMLCRGKTCVFICLVAKISDWFLQQRINIKSCVKSGTNASSIVQYSQRLMGKNLWKRKLF